MCGDGVVEGEEMCDEIDEVDGDGCNVDCVVSGTELFVESWDFAGGRDYGNGLAILDDGRFVIAGFVTQRGGDQDALVQLRDAEGAIVWNEIVANVGVDIGEQVFVDENGVIVSCGTLADPVTGFDQGFVHGYTIDRELVLDIVLAEAEGSAIKACKARGDGTFVVAGTTGPAATGQGLVIVYDADGGEVWRHVQAGVGVELRGVTSHPQGGIVATGLTQEPRLAIAIGLSGDGELVWEPPLGLEDGRVDECFDAARDDAGVYAIGRILGDAGQDAWVGRYDGWPPTPSTSNAVTQNEYRDAFHAMVVHEDGDRVLVGSRDGEGHDIWVARFDPTYQRRWERSYAGDGDDNDKAWDVGFAPDGTLLVVGYETTLDESANLWLRRYAP